MFPPIQAGKFRFDRSLLVFGDAGRMGGVFTSDGPLLVGESTAVGVLHHRGGLYATGMMDLLPDPGVTNFQHTPDAGPQYRWWEPKPGWGKPFTLPKTPRVAIITGAIQTDFADRIDSRYSDIAKLGVAVCTTFGNVSAVSAFCSPFPAVNATIQGSDDGLGNHVDFPVPTFFPSSSLSGGDVLAIDVGPTGFDYAGASSSAGDLAFYETASGDAISHVPMWSGAVLVGTYTLNASPIEKGWVYARQTIAQQYLTFATAAAKRLNSFRYVAVQGNTAVIQGSFGSANADANAIFAALTGGNPLCQRRTYAAGDSVAAADQAIAAILDFFS